MKKEAFLINTARGAIVRQEDLKWALEKGIIAGAALDVFEKEPPTDLEFLGLSNLICTPHIGGHAHEGLMAMGEHAVNNLLAFFNNRPRGANETG
jgi:D-3-phosphoglycerate dehydrogenase